MNNLPIMPIRAKYADLAEKVKNGAIAYTIEGSIGDINGEQLRTIYESGAQLVTAKDVENKAINNYIVYYSSKYSENDKLGSNVTLVELPMDDGVMTVYDFYEVEKTVTIKNIYTYQLPTGHTSALYKHEIEFPNANILTLIVYGISHPLTFTNAGSNFLINGVSLGDFFNTYVIKGSLFYDHDGNEYAVIALGSEGIDNEANVSSILGSETTVTFYQTNSTTISKIKDSITYL